MRQTSISYSSETMKWYRRTYFDNCEIWRGLSGMEGRCLSDLGEEEWEKGEHDWSFLLS